MAGVYTDHTRKATHIIYYSFTCQHCGQESGTLVEELTGTANKRKSGYRVPLNEKEEAALAYEASHNLKSKLKSRQTEVTNGDYSSFDGKCPHCGKIQKWGIGSFGRDVIVRALALTGLLAFLGVFPTAFATGKFDAVRTTKVFGLILAASFVVFFLWQMIVWIRNKRSTKAFRKDDAPHIQWNL